MSSPACEERLSERLAERVLEACGFRARRGLATMPVAATIAPNHGPASVALGGEPEITP